MRIFNKAVFLLCSISLIVMSCTSEKETILGNDSIEIIVDSEGAILSLQDVNNKINYLHQIENNSSLLGIQVNGEVENPSEMTFNSETGLIKMTYPKNAIEAAVQFKSKDGFLTFEVVSITNKEKVELVLWGPFPTKIGETIGETVGVVRNKEFAIGIQALNKRTMGGFPSSDDSTPTYNIFGTTSLVDISDSLNVLYRGNTGMVQPYGSSIQAYTRNRAKDRVVEAMNHTSYLAPAFKDEGIIGSKIALFGCSPSEVLNTLEQIEIKEGLPHTTINGVWSKKAKVASSAYLIQNFSENSIDKALELTQKAGLKYLYHSDPFENWGQFDLKKKDFPNNWAGMKVCVEKATAQGIDLGVHTLSNFITTNDTYVTPVPDQRLAKVGFSKTTKAIDSESKNIEIEDPLFFNQMKNNSLHAVVIGNEIIRYQSVSESAPWTLLNCERGAYGTKVSSHESGAEIGKLADHAYKTFLTNTDLSIEMSKTIARLFNETGLRQISFDGLEGNYSTGMGEYGNLLFTEAWYSNLNEDIKGNFIMDASRSGHYFWHMFTRMNWGEPWYAGFRESQTNYRILNQDYFRRNYIPGMLGWFSMRPTSSIEDIEWMLARSAAFDAGYCLLTSASTVEQNGYGAEILEKIKQWEIARMSGAFSVDQKKRMENIKDEFTLETVSENLWQWTPFKVIRFEHKFIVRQPGEPVWSTFEFENKEENQPLQFILNTTNNSSVSEISIEIDDFKRIELDVVIKPKQFLKYTGGNKATLFDENWIELKKIDVPLDKITVNTGAHNLKVDCVFKGDEKASLKLELKLAGTSEEVSIK